MGEERHKIDFDKAMTVGGIGVSAFFVALGVYLGSLAVENLGASLPGLLDENYYTTLTEKAVLVAIIGLIQGLAIDRGFDTNRPATQLKYGTLSSYIVFLFLASLAGAKAEFALATETTLWVWMSSIIVAALLNLKNWEAPTIREGLKYPAVSLLLMTLINAIISAQ